MPKDDSVLVDMIAKDDSQRKCQELLLNGGLAIDRKGTPLTGRILII